MLVGRSAIRTLAREDLDALRRMRLFSGASEETFALLASSALLENAPADVQLFHEGSRLEHMYVLTEGMVELYSEHGKDDFGFMLLQPPAAFILAALVIDGSCLNSARTLRGSRLILMPAAAVQHAIGADSAFARAFEFELALAYRRVLKELKNRKFRPVIQRLANWLLGQAEADGAGGIVRLPFSRRRLAAHLGATPETLSRIFADLAAHGVSSQGHEIRIASIADLAKVAHPDPLIDGPG